MIRLQTLGSLDLRASDGTSMQPVLRQTKRLALLAYLAVEKPGQFHRRDHLLGLFWPESDLKGGRASLNQAVFFLRKYLGNDAILGRGDEEIAINPERVSCDAAEFQVHIVAGRFADAMEVYGGQLMPGIFVDEAEGFEQWIETKRDTLTRGAMRACVALADAAAERTDHGDVAHWLRRAISYFPYDENLHRRLISALDRAGDRVAALLAYEELEKTLRAEFESTPSAETQQLIKEVRARTDAQALPAYFISRRSADEPGTVVTIAPPPRRRYVGAVVGFVLLAIAGIAWGAWSTRETRTDPALPINRLAVLYFNDASPSHELGYLSEGLATALIEHLGEVRRIEVISQNGVRPFRGDSIPLDSIARQLRAGTIIAGSLSRSGDVLRVNVEIVNGATGIVVSTEKFERPVGELFGLLDDVASEVGTYLRSRLGEEIQLKQYQAETNVAAWQAMQKAQERFASARVSVDHEDITSAVEQFSETETLIERAAQLDQDWPAPLLLKAQTYVYRAWHSLAAGNPGAIKPYLDNALLAAEEALRRDKTSGAALVERGRVHYAAWQLLPATPQEKDALLKKAETDLTRAVSLNSESARGESTLSLIFHSQGRFEAARQAARRALEADAYLEDAAQITMRLFETSFEVGDDEEAGYWCDEVRRRMPGQWPAAYCDLMLLVSGPTKKVDTRKALYILENFGTADRSELRTSVRPVLTMLAAAAIGQAGDIETAERMAAEAKRAAPTNTELLYWEAVMRARLNQKEQARELIERYVARNPHARPRLQEARFFKPVYAAASGSN